MRGLFSTPPSLSLESVDFQGVEFFKQMTTIYALMKSLPENKMGDSPQAQDLMKLIKSHTGLTVSLDIGVYPASVEIPAVNKNNVLANSFIREYLSSSDGLKMIANSKGVVKGSVNLRTGKVTGVFADISAIIHMPTEMIAGSKYSAEELAAVTLHEVGHLVTYYEFMSRSVTTNQALAGMSKALDGTNDIDERTSVLITTTKALNLKAVDEAALARTKGSQTAEIVVLSQVVQESKAELGSNIYDFSSWEYLADQYTARMGAGRYVVTALDKLHRGVWNISFRSLPAYLFFEAFKLVLLFSPLNSIAATLFMMDSEGDGTYNTPEIRFKRVRQQIVLNMKDKDLTQDDRARLTADLAAIDAVLEHVNDRRQFFGVLWDTIWPNARKARSQAILQQQLEELAMNDLFARANDLKQLKA
jgi:hypothetical protein